MMIYFNIFARSALLGLLPLLWLPCAIASDGLRTAALTGHSVPGVASNATFLSFISTLPPSLNNRGKTVFVGRIAGSDITAANDAGIWSEGSGSLDLVAREGDVAAGTPAGVVFGEFNHFVGPVINDVGQTAYFARLAGAGINITNYMGIWRQSVGNTSLVARSRDFAPGFTPDTKFGPFFTSVNPPPVGIVMNNKGTIAFQASATGRASTGIWRYTDTGLELFAGTGNPTPELESSFGRLSGENGPVLNDQDEIAFNDLAGSTTDQSSLWSDRKSSGIERLVRTATQAPGTEPGVAYSLFFFHPGFNSSGQVAFTAYIVGPGVTGANNIGLWSEGRGNGLELIARTGSPAPGTGSGVNFSARFSERVLNSRGEVAFLSDLEGPGVGSTNNTGLWTEGGGTGLRLLARSGDPAPGTESGVNFGTFVAADAPVLNARGQAAFTNSLTGVTIGATNSFGIWAEDISRNLHLIARTGDLLDVSDDPFHSDLRTITALSFQTRSGNDDGKASGFNDRGQLTFWARFTDGTEGIFVSDLVAVPEPATVGALIAAALHFASVRQFRFSPGVVRKPLAA